MPKKERNADTIELDAGFKAPVSLMTQDRVLDVWTEIVDRHALLACEVEYEGASEIYFRYASSTRTQLLDTQ